MYLVTHHHFRLQITGGGLTSTGPEETVSLVEATRWSGHTGPISRFIKLNKSTNNRDPGGEFSRWYGRGPGPGPGLSVPGHTGRQLGVCAGGALLCHVG